MPSTFEENLDKSLFNSAKDYAKETALKKAEEVAQRLQGVNNNNNNNNKYFSCKPDMSLKETLKL